MCFLLRDVLFVCQRAVLAASSRATSCRVMSHLAALMPHAACLMPDVDGVLVVHETCPQYVRMYETRGHVYGHVRISSRHLHTSPTLPISSPHRCQSPSAALALSLPHVSRSAREQLRISLPSSSYLWHLGWRRSVSVTASLSH
jgi:hypothetical protein